MINLCCVSDKGFLAKGLTLYESLLKNSNNFILHYLCVDDATFNVINNYSSDNLRAYHINDLLSNDNNLQQLKDSDNKYFLWSLASYFSNYLINKIQNDITYIDADIYVHEDINAIIAAMGNKDVGVFRHRQFELNWDVPSGLFNVGIVHFKFTNAGKALLNWWTDAVLHKRYPKLAQCGDQKYLDAFYMNARNHLFIDGNIGHGAPWQWYLYDFASYKDDRCITWNGNKQKLCFTHFSQFEYDLNKDEYIPSTMHHIYTPMSLYTIIDGLKLIYDEYFQEIKNTVKKYNLGG